MPKRLTDTEKWKDEWFCSLSVKDKLTYLYIIDNCDAVGVWKPNFRLAEFQLSFKVDWYLFEKKLSKDRLLITEKFWWLRKFCDFQYGKLSEASKSKTTESYIKMLKNHRLWIAYTEGMYTPKEKDKEKDTVLIKKEAAEKIKQAMLDDFILRDMAMRVRGFTEEQFQFAIDDFLTSVANEEGALQREQGQINSHFANWCRQHEKTVKSAKNLKPAKKQLTDADKW